MGEVVTCVFPSGRALPKAPLPEETDKRFVGMRLWAVREALGLKPIEVCRTLGITSQLYSNWERGRNRPEIEHAILFCTRYGVGLDWLYLGDRSTIHRDRDVADQAIGLYEEQKRHPSAA